MSTRNLNKHVSIPYSTIKIESDYKSQIQSHVSIPYSTIKIANQLQGSGQQNRFQFLIVRLKLRAFNLV